MNNPIRRKSVCLVLALWLALCSPTSSRAFLTELLVGGQIAVEIGGVVLGALPQISLLATSLFGLAQSSEDVATTITNIISVFLPKKKHKQEKQKQTTVKIKTDPSIEAESIQPAGKPGTNGRRPGAVDASSNADAVQGDSIEQQVDAIVLSFVRQNAMLGKLQSLDEGSADREALGAGYTELVSVSADLIEKLVMRLLDAINDGDKDLIDRFLEKFSSVDATARVALVPVLAQVVQKGQSFNDLHGEGVGLFERITAVYKALVR